MLWQAIHCAEISKKNVLIDTNAPTFCKREQFLDWFNFDEYHLIYISAPERICLKNNFLRQRQIPFETILKMIKEYEIPNLQKEKRWTSITVYENKNNEEFELIGKVSQ